MRTKLMKRKTSQQKSLDLKTYLAPREVTLDELQSFVQALEVEETRKEAIALLHDLAAQLPRDRKGKPGLCFYTPNFDGFDKPIRILVHPAVFRPEEWSRTFADGLFKEPDQFEGKSVLELGSGSGWIALLLLNYSGVHRVHGVDINPIAVAIAALNAWLNGTDPDGTLKMTPFGIPIVEAFRVEQSDLLAEPIGRNESFDHVIGCIPQVLHPDDENKEGPTTPEALHDLSNYCFKEGILEDSFGLSLVAKALEQASLCLKSAGLVTLTLGGRPGFDIIEGVFRRRGYDVTLQSTRRVQQAADTDLSSLVAVEDEQGIHFHLYLSEKLTASVSASEAVVQLEKGHPIFHDLFVVQGRVKLGTPMLAFAKNVHALRLDTMRRELDLSTVSVEQMGFLARFAKELLKRHDRIAYPDEQGDRDLRAKIAKFLRLRFNFATTPDQIFVGPERKQLVYNILAMVVGKKVMVSESLVNGFYRRVIAWMDMQLVIGSGDLVDLRDTDDEHAPNICFLAPQELVAPTPRSLQALIDQARAHPERWYVIDESANFDIAAPENALLSFMGAHCLPPNLVFLYGMIKNALYPDMQLSFLLNAPESWLKSLAVDAELTYSTIVCTNEIYYDWLFDLNMPHGDDAPNSEATAGKLSDQFQSIEQDESFLFNPIDNPEAPDVLRLDYGEFVTPVPQALLEGLIIGLLKPQPDMVFDDVRLRVQSFLRFTKHVEVGVDRIVLGDGEFSLLCAIVETMKRRLGRAPIVAVPYGTYGLVYPMVKYHGGTVVTIRTDEEAGFLMTLKDITDIAEKPDLLWLTQPNNPSGCFYSAATVAAIMQLCTERQIYVFADEIFFLLSDPQLGKWTLPQLSFFGPVGAKSPWLFVGDGLSKAFAASGLRCGYMVCPDDDWAQEIQGIAVVPPKYVLYAWAELFSAFDDNAEKLANIEAYLSHARALLHEQRDEMLALLRKHKIADRLDESQRGGLFMLAKLGDDGAERLAKEMKVLVNSPEWSRTPGWCRVCCCEKPARFKAAVERLRVFLESEFPVPKPRRSQASMDQAEVASCKAPIGDDGAEKQDQN